ncbi:MAG TPA: cytochrome c peroxidase [Nannocystaceae bacterium]|nr:cytochrome c peroxidase [Nannocystaceae bacterium]
MSPTISRIGLLATLALVLFACTRYGAGRITPHERRVALRKLSPDFVPPGVGKAGFDPEDGHTAAGRGNALEGDPKAIALGQLLFFDKGFTAGVASGMTPTACATCHDPAQNFADDRQLGIGASGVVLARRTPTVMNSTRRHFYFWNGRADSLWSQAMLPFENEHEMHSNRLRIIHRVRTEPRLRDAYEAVFGPLPSVLADAARFPADAMPRQADEREGAKCEPPGACAVERGLATTTVEQRAPPPDFDPVQQFTPPSGETHDAEKLDSTAADITAWYAAWDGMSCADRELATKIFVQLAKAIAAYEHELVATSSPYDIFITALRAKDSKWMDRTLDATAQRGLKAFIGRARCVRCHSGADLTDEKFHYLGLPPTPGVATHDDMWLSGAKLVDTRVFGCTGPFADGCARAARRRLEGPFSVESITRRPFRKTAQRRVRAQVRTPTLRNVASNAFFMHGGHFAALDDVLSFYAQPTAVPLVADAKGKLRKVQRRDRRMRRFDPALVPPLEAFLGTLQDDDIAPALRVDPWTPP